MENMKMSELFNGSMTSKGGCIYDDCGKVADFFNCSREASGVARAVNNHDRLAEENAELAKEKAKSDSWCIDIFNDFSFDEVSNKSPSIIGAWKHGSLLAKHK